MEARVLGIANVAIRPLLRSRFHRILSSRLMLLDYTGQKTGRRYTFPIGYFPWDDGDVLSFSSLRGWPAAIEGAPKIRILVRGQWSDAQPTVTKDREVKADVLGEFAERNGPRAARGLLLGLPGGRLPSREELLAAADKTIIIRFKHAASL